MFLRLLWQTWRSVVSALIAIVLLIITGVFFPEDYNRFFDLASGLKDLLVQMSGPGGLDNPQIGAALRAFVGEQTFLMTMYFLFSRVVVLTLILFVWNLLWEAVFGRGYRE